MNQTEMLHQMCHEVLAEADVRAICKNRGLPNQVASSRQLLENLFLSDGGVAVAVRTLDRTEIALLHLLRGHDKPVDVAFFSRLEPPKNEPWSHGTFTQRFQGVFSRVKDRLMRRGILLLALGPETLPKKTNMERWQFALPVQFARHLPPLVESAKRLSGEGDWRRDVARKYLKTAVGQGADSLTKNDRVEIVNGELRWGGQPFRADRVVEWGYPGGDIRDILDFLQRKPWRSGVLLRFSRGFPVSPGSGRFPEAYLTVALILGPSSLGTEGPEIGFWAMPDREKLAGGSFPLTHHTPARTPVNEFLSDSSPQKSWLRHGKKERRERKPGPSGFPLVEIQKVPVSASVSG